MKNKRGHNIANKVPNEAREMSYVLMDNKKAIKYRTEPQTRTKASHTIMSNKGAITVLAGSKANTDTYCTGLEPAASVV
jgi:hypothetical protein